MNKDALAENLKILETLGKERENRTSDFIRHLLLLASSMLAIIIALHPKVFLQSGKWLFIISLISLTCCVLSGLVTSYMPSFISQRMFYAFRNALTKYIETNESPKDLVKVKDYSIFNICSWICPISFICSILSLVIYTIVNL